MIVARPLVDPNEAPWVWPVLTASPGALCPDLLRYEQIGAADGWRGRVVRAVFWCLRAWPPRLALLAALLTACASGPPTVTFEARGFVVAYRAQRDEALLRMAPAIAKCERMTAVASDALRAKCDQLTAARAQWAGYDLAVFEAMLAGQRVRSVDLERAGEWALKIGKLAADILL